MFYQEGEKMLKQQRVENRSDFSASSNWGELIDLQVTQLRPLAACLALAANQVSIQGFDATVWTFTSKFHCSYLETLVPIYFVDLNYYYQT